MLELRIREARESLAWSQEDLARRMHVSQPTISNWEAGRKSPRTQIMIRLAQVLGVSMEWLSTGRGPMQAPPMLVSSPQAAIYLPEREADENRLLLCYSRLKPQQRVALLSFLESLHRSLDSAPPL